MKVSRRLFIQGLTSAAGLAGMHTFGAGFAAPKGNLRLGILSDIHIRTPEDIKPFLKALTWFRARLVDGVVIAGDLADQGLLDQLQWVADAWYKVFPNDRDLNGRHVEKLFLYGNHDIDGYPWGTRNPTERAERYKKSIAKDRKAAWERMFHEPYEPVFAKTVKGYTFIGAHWHNWKNIPQVKDFMAKIGPKLDPKLPFFYAQHAHPRNTCMGPDAWGHDDGCATQALSAFPNAIAFSGHSHYSLTDGRSIWQGAFTSINTASLRYIHLMEGHENGPGGSGNLQMPAVDVYEGKQGMLMTVFDDRIVLERREFVYDESLGDDWVLPPTCKEGKPYSFDGRAKIAVAPQFASGAKVEVSRIKGKTRNGKPADQVKVTFPAAREADRKNPVLDYEVCAVAREGNAGKTVRSKRVFNEKCYLAQSRWLPTVSCVFGVSELPKNMPLYFAVRPAECFGTAGAPIRSADLTLT